MALVLPILMLIILGIFKFGILFNNYLQLTDAARSGARQLAVERGQATPCDDATRELANASSALGGTITVTITESGDASTYTNTAIGGNVGTPTQGSACPTLVSGSSAHVNATYPCDLKIFDINVAPSCTLSTTVTERVE